MAGKHYPSEEFIETAMRKKTKGRQPSQMHVRSTLITGLQPVSGTSYILIHYILLAARRLKICAASFRYPTDVCDSGITKH